MNERGRTLGDLGKRALKLTSPAPAWRTRAVKSAYLKHSPRKLDCQRRPEQSVVQPRMHVLDTIRLLRSTVTKQLLAVCATIGQVAPH